MRTAVDTNIFVRLFEGDGRAVAESQRALEEISQRGRLAVCPAVHAELSAGRSVGHVDEFFAEKDIEVDWGTDEDLWRLAGERFALYATERRGSGVEDPGPRRILADFLIGAHALRYAGALLTTDTGIFSTYFPDLEVIHPGS